MGIIIMFFGIFVGLYIAYAIGHGDGKREIKKEAVEYGFAYYNSLTGDWQWKLETFDPGAVNETDKNKSI